MEDVKLKHGASTTAKTYKCGLNTPRFSESGEKTFGNVVLRNVQIKLNPRPICNVCLMGALFILCNVLILSFLFVVTREDSLT